jgi:hypothetical protein
MRVGELLPHSFKQGGVSIVSIMRCASRIQSRDSGALSVTPVARNQSSERQREIALLPIFGEFEKLCLSPTRK